MSIAKASSVLLRRLTRYQIERAECALRTLKSLKKHYKKVEKKRKKVGASSVTESSLTYILIQYENAETQYTSIVESVSETSGIYTKDSSENVGILDWSGEDFFSEADAFIVSTWQSIKTYAGPISNVEKENREISRVRLAVTAIFLALTANTAALFIPEQTRFEIGTSAAGFFSSNYSYLRDYLYQEEAVSAPPLVQEMKTPTPDAGHSSQP